MSFTLKPSPNALVIINIPKRPIINNNDKNIDNFGLLKNITINESGVYLDNEQINSNITINDLELTNFNCIKLKIESNQDDIHPGGFNIFGKGSGDFQQDIEMNVIYQNIEK